MKITGKYNRYYHLKKGSRRFLTHFHFVGFHDISFGFSICFRSPSISLHVPFGFIFIGFRGIDIYNKIKAE